MGGTFVGTMLGAAGSILDAVLNTVTTTTYWSVVLFVVAVVGIKGPEALPQRRRLVPQEVAHSETGSFQFGFEMGTGFRTYSPNPAPLLVATLLFLKGNLFIGIGAGIAFAIGRSIAANLRLQATDSDQFDTNFTSRPRLLAVVGLGSSILPALVAGRQAIG